MVHHRKPEETLKDIHVWPKGWQTKRVFTSDTKVSEQAHMYKATCAAGGFRVSETDNKRNVYQRISSPPPTPRWLGEG